jgi:hypothetical protein
VAYLNYYPIMFLYGLTGTTKHLKGNDKLSACLIKHHTMKKYWGNGGIAPRIFNLGTKRR